MGITPQEQSGKGTPKKGGGRGRGKEAEKKKPKTAEELDAEMDAYMMKDEKTALKKLDEDMDAYKAAGEKKKEEGKEAEEAPAAEEGA